MPARLSSINIEHQGTSTQGVVAGFDITIEREQQEPSCWDAVKAVCQTGLICPYAPNYKIQIIPNDDTI